MPYKVLQAFILSALTLAQQQLKHHDEAQTALQDAAHVIKRMQAVTTDAPDLLIAEIPFREAEVKASG